jgi:hypothetical protein
VLAVGVVSRAPYGARSTVSIPSPHVPIASSIRDKHMREREKDHDAGAV